MILTAMIKSKQFFRVAYLQNVVSFMRLCTCYVDMQSNIFLKFSLSPPPSHYLQRLNFIEGEKRENKFCRFN
jgi:hypothetical protein